ncbi:hypoxanthine-guanine phosphoribosyltransferase-like isoform X2 [Paramacrobiotus metropolitanus]|nr:hypoxanthine-guanine phosphoribosyltransferase-like isoform X2 [Paramacrobiotus metropolitanus]
MEAISHAVIIPDSFLSYPPSSFCIPSFYAKDVDSVIIPEGLIRDRIKGLAREIFNVYASSAAEPLVLVCVLKSAFKFFSALQLEIEHLNVESCGTSDFPQSLQINGEPKTNGSKNSHPDGQTRRSLPLFCEFIRVKSYVNTQSVTGSDVQVQGVLCPEEAFSQKNVLIVEDIIDSGRTMQALIQNLKQHNPKSLRVASMLWKRVAHGGKSVPYPPDFFGFEIPDRFVIGFGMDYNEKFRDLNHLCIINEAGIQRYAVNPSK